MKVLVLPVALLLMVACAAGGRRARPPHEDVLVTVENDLVFRGEATVRMVSSTGTRTLLGVVPAGRKKIFRFEESAFTGGYRLLAEPTSGQPIESPSFALFAGAQLHWALQVNVVTVAEEDASHFKRPEPPRPHAWPEDLCVFCY